MKKQTKPNNFADIIYFVFACNNRLNEIPCHVSITDHEAMRERAGCGSVNGCISLPSGVKCNCNSFANESHRFSCQQTR